MRPDDKPQESGAEGHAMQDHAMVPASPMAGRRPPVDAHALTLPGMESKDADRSGITLRDHVGAIGP